MELLPTDLKVIKLIPPEFWRHLQEMPFRQSKR